jgi:hypothetical protein
VKDLTAGSGYKLVAKGAGERLIEALRAKATRLAAQNGSAEFLFATRELANAAIDLLRAEQCTIESLSVVPARWKTSSSENVDAINTT